MSVNDHIFDRTVNGLATALNFRLLKQNIHSSNVANANTPDYKAMKMDFEQALHEAIDPHGVNNLRTLRPEHFKSGVDPIDESNPDIYEDPDGVVNQSGNSVNVDREMAELAQNRILYNATVSMIRKKFGMTKYALSEGR